MMKRACRGIYRVHRQEDYISQKWSIMHEHVNPKPKKKKTKPYFGA